MPVSELSEPLYLHVHGILESAHSLPFQTLTPEPRQKLVGGPPNHVSMCHRYVDLLATRVPTKVSLKAPRSCGQDHKKSKMLFPAGARFVCTWEMQKQLLKITERRQAARNWQLPIPGLVTRALTFATSTVDVELWHWNS